MDVTFNPEYYDNRGDISVKDLVFLGLYLKRYFVAFGEIVLFHPFLGTIGFGRGVKAIYDWKKGKEGGGYLHVYFVNNPPTIEL